MQGPSAQHQSARDRGPAGGRPRGADARQRIRRERTKPPVRESTLGVSAKNLLYPAALRRGLGAPADGGGGDRLDADRLVVVAKVRLGGAFVGALGAGHLSVSHPQTQTARPAPCGPMEQPRAGSGIGSNCGSIRVEAGAKPALPPHEWWRFVTHPNRPDPPGPRTAHEPDTPG